MTTRTVDITELVLRDGHQSLLATRMAIEDMVPACEDIDQAGYWSVECWGGATFDSCIRFLNEDPWERLRTFRKLMPNIAPADAAARPEPARLPALRGPRRRPVRREVRRERHGRLPRVRRAERHPQPEARAGRRAPDRQARPGHHLLHDQPAAHDRRGSSRWPSSSWTWAATRSASRTWPPCSSRSRPSTWCAASRRPAARHVRVHVHVHATTGVTMVSLMKAIEAGADMRRHRDQFAQPRPGPQPHRERGRDARGHRLPGALDKGRLLRIKEHFATVRPRYAEFLSQHHRRRDRDLRQPDPRRHDLEHGEPARAAGRGRPGEGGARRGAPGAPGCRLPARW